MATQVAQISGIGFIERVHCPGCGSRQLKRLLSVPFGDPSLSGFVENYYRIAPNILRAPYQLEQCICGMIFQRFVGNDALMAELYGRWAPTADEASEVPCFDENLASPHKSRDGHELMTISLYLRKPIDRLKVLDFGMGWGLWPAIAGKLGADAYGTELSEKMAVNAEAHGVKVIREIVGPFDFINLEQVIEHVPNPSGLLRQLSNALAPRGIVKLSLPHASKAASVIAKIRSGTYRGDYDTIIPIQPLEHVNSFTPEAVKIMAETVGLIPVKPRIRQRYAFLTRGGIPRRPRAVLKEMARPLWQYHNRRNIYAWLARPQS